MRPRFKTIFTTTPTTGEVNVQKSRTVPGMALTIKEILERFARGLPITNGKEPIYHGEEDLPDFRTMDLSEIEEYKDNVRNQIKTAKDDYQRHLNSIAAQKDQRIKDLEAQLDGQKNSTPPQEGA